MSAQESSKRQPRPRLFLPFIDTELITVLSSGGPLRAKCVKEAFTDEVVRSLQKPKYHSANLLVAMPAFVRRGGKDRLIGINPRFKYSEEMRNLMRALSQGCALREVINDLLPGESDLFASFADHPPVRYESLISTKPRTLTLLVLHLMDGKCTSGKLARSVLDVHPKVTARAIERLVSDQILIKSDSAVRFDDNLGWATQLRALLERIANEVPGATRHALNLRQIRESSASGASYVHGQRFRVFGGRVNEAILAFLAANGPSTSQQIAAAVGSVNNRAMNPMVKSGIIAKVVVKPNQRFGRELYSLNAAFPVYRELRVLLRTDVILDSAFPFREKGGVLYQGDDLRDDSAKFDPYAIFGFGKGGASTNVLGMLAHCVNGEIDAASLLRLLNEHSSEGMRSKTLPRLERNELITSRRFGGMTLYRLNPRWPAAEELRDLLKAIERVWNEYEDAALDEHRLFPPQRKKREISIAESRRRLDNVCTDAGHSLRP